MRDTVDKESWWSVHWNPCRESGCKTWPGHCDVFLDKTLYSLHASLSTRVYKWVLVNCHRHLMKCWGGYPVMGWHPIQGSVLLLLVISSYWNGDKLALAGWVTWLQYRLLPVPPKISLVILFTVCQIILTMLVWRIWYWIS